MAILNLAINYDDADAATLLSVFENDAKLATGKANPSNAEILAEIKKDIGVHLNARIQAGVERLAREAAAGINVTVS